MIGLWVEKPIDPPSEMAVLLYEQPTTAQSARLLAEVARLQHTSIHTLLQMHVVTDPEAAQTDVAREALDSEEETEAATEDDLDHLNVPSRLEEMHMQDHLRGHVDIQGHP